MKKFIIALLVVLASLLSALGANAHVREEPHHHSGVVLDKPLIEAMSECAIRGGSIAQLAEDAVHDWIHLTAAVKQGTAKIDGQVMFVAAVDRDTIELYWVNPVGESGLIVKAADIAFLGRYRPSNQLWWCGL